MAAKKRKRKSKLNVFFENKAATAVTACVILILLFAGSFFLTTFIFDKVTREKTTETASHPETVQTTEKSENPVDNNHETTTKEKNEKETTTEKPTSSYTPGNVDYPSDTASWQMICLNKNRYVGSDTEEKISLSYVAGSGERMDSRAAAAYEKMYDAAKADGYYLTPCSGYRSYSTQKRLYYEFYDEYISQGYSSDEAHRLTSKRRNPPGSSEHNIGICMDIICAASSANFQNTEEYAWLCENAADYGFILRYPEDKADVTGVKFEPWHWRYVGVENARAIKASGLCLEEYLGLA